jgi:hypothetical protein
MYQNHGKRKDVKNNYSRCIQNLTFALFNNHWQGYAPRNAVDMMKALKLPFTELPVQIKFPDDEVEKPKKEK